MGFPSGCFTVGVAPKPFALVLGAIGRMGLGERGGVCISIDLSVTLLLFDGGLQGRVKAWEPSTDW